MSGEEIETYEPELVPQKPLAIDSPDTTFNDIMGKDGLISTRLNQRVIIQRIAKDLYKNEKSGLRELYMNAVRACRIAKKKYGGKPRVEIMMNQAKRTLIIQDIGATGISVERFKKVLLELGTSDNLDGSETGQFGMGFASYVTLSSVVIVETKTREGDNYKIIGKDAASFQHVGKSSLKEYGTKLTLTCYDTVKFNDLVDYLVDLVRFQEVPTFLVLNEFDQYPVGFTNGTNGMPQTSFEKYLQRGAREPYQVVSVITEDYEFYGLTSYSNQSIDYNTYLLGVPIESTITSPFHEHIINIKNERKFRPMPDRDRMTEEADKKIMKDLHERLQEIFNGVDIQTYQQFVDSPDKQLFCWLLRHNEYLPKHLTQVSEKLHLVRVKGFLGNKPNGKYTSSLAHVLNETPYVYYQNSYDPVLTDKMRQLMPDYKPIALRKSTKKGARDWHLDLNWMKQFGIPMAKDVLKKHKVKLQREQTAKPFDVKGHKNHYDSCYSTVALERDEIDESVIRVDNHDIWDVIRFVKRYPNPYTFTRNAEELDGTKARKMSEWEKTLPDLMCLTNKGSISVREFAAKDPEDRIISYDWEENYANLFELIDKEILIGKDQILPAMLYLWQTGNEAHTQLNASAIVGDMFGARLYGQTLDFFATHVDKLPRTHLELFANILEDYFRYSKHGYLEEREEEQLCNKVFDAVKQLPEFEDDIFERLKWYHHCSVSMKDADFAGVAENLTQKTLARIKQNDDLFKELVITMILPQMFGEKYQLINIRKVEPSYVTTYAVKLHVPAEHGIGVKHNSEHWKVNTEVMDMKIKVIPKNILEVTMWVNFS